MSPIYPFCRILQLSLGWIVHIATYGKLTSPLVKHSPLGLRFGLKVLHRRFRCGFRTTFACLRWQGVHSNGRANQDAWAKQPGLITILFFQTWLDKTERNQWQNTHHIFSNVKTICSGDALFITTLTPTHHNIFPKGPPGMKRIWKDQVRLSRIVKHLALQYSFLCNNLGWVTAHLVFLNFVFHIQRFRFRLPLWKVSWVAISFGPWYVANFFGSQTS